MAYGLEYSGGRITVVRAQKRKGRVETEVLACGEDPSVFPSWSGLAEQIRRDQESGRAMVASLAPANDSFIRPLQAPFPSLKKARAVLPSLLDVQLPFPLEQCTCCFAHVHKPEGGNVRALAVAIPTDRLQQQLENVRSIGLDPEWMEQESLALWRCALREHPAGVAGARVVVYLGNDRTVAVSGKNQDPVASFSTKAAWSDAMDAAAGDKLVTRLQQHLAGMFRGESAPRTEFIVCGPAAANATRLRERLDVPPESWKVMENPASCLAATLAEGLINPDVWHENVRVGPLIHSRVIRHEQQRENRSLRRVTAAAACLAFASIGSVMLVGRAHEALQADIRREAAELTGMNYIPRGQELFIAKQAVDASGERYREFRLWLEPDAYPRFDEVVRAARQLNTTLETLSVRAGALLARGSSVDWNDPDKITRPLVDLGWKVETERKDAGQDERVHFTVRAQP